MLGEPHHDASARHVSNPTPALGETVEVSVDVPAQTGMQEVEMRAVRDGEQFWHEGERDGRRWSFELPCTQATVGYRFYCHHPEGDRWLTGLGTLDWDPPDTWDFKLLTGSRAPAWVAETVFYQIFPDRFATTGAPRPLPDWAEPRSWETLPRAGRHSSKALYGGDLDGIRQHLAHLTDLGVGGIYLTPFFPARSSHRYDASTFARVDEILGGDEALSRLVDTAHRRGIRVIGDLTLNHTGRSHEWFAAARTDPSATEAAFYHFDDHPDAYVSWLGVASLPKLDHRSPELRRRLYEGGDSVLGRYVQPPFDLDGWRIDVANMTGRLGMIDLNHQVARTARRTLDALDPDLWLVAEHVHDTSLDVPGDGWHGVMNYAGVARPVVSWLGDSSSLATLMPGPGQARRDGVQMARSMDAVRAAQPWQVTVGSMALLGSHDTARWRSMACSDELARVGVGLLMTLPGSPCLLYGDEIGLEGLEADTARRTMPWNTDEWDQQMLSWYRDLIRLRASRRALCIGGFRWVHTEADAVVFLRESPEERLLVRAARRPTEPIALPTELLDASEAAPLFGADRLAPRAGSLVLPADGPDFSVWEL